MSETFMHVAVPLAAFVVGFTVTFAISRVVRVLVARLQVRRHRPRGRAGVADVQATWNELDRITDRIAGYQERLKKEEE